MPSPTLRLHEYQALLEAAPDPMVLVDVQGRITLCNSAAEALFGYPRAELVGQLIEVLVPERFQELHQRDRDAYFGAPKRLPMGTRGMELSARRRDGSEFPVDISLSSLVTDEGTFAIAAIRDLSRRRAVEEKFRALLEASPDAMVITDRRGTIVIVNAQAERVFGHARAELIGQPVELLVPPRFRARHPQFREDYFARPKARPMGAGLELYGLRKDGTEFPAEISLSPLETEEGLLAISAIRDLTERKKVEGKFRALLEGAPDAIVIAARDGRIVLVNARAEQLFGYSREEMLDEPVELLIPERYRETHPRLRDGYFRDPRSRPMGAGLELFGRRKDGTEFPAEISLSPLETEEGLLAMTAIRDVTERREAEKRMRALLVRVEASNRELQDFATVASHDLQEPLRKVLTFSDRLKTLLGDQLDPVAQDYLTRMMRATARMQQLINDLLAFSRVTRKGQPFAPTNLTDVVRQVRTDLEARLEQTAGSVDVGELPTIEADPLQMRQLFQNLISNGLKFHKPGVPPRVRLWAEPAEGGRSVRIFVADDGIGFDEKYLDRLFTIFQRLHGKVEYEGTGVGLAICRRIVERHGGQITARSRPGEGSTFEVTLPLAQPQEEIA